MAVTGWAMVGRSLSAPDWVRGMVEQRLAETLPGFRVLFGDVQLRLEQDGRTKIILLDVDVQTAAGAPVAVLSDIEIGLTAYDLIRRKVVLRELSVSGAFVTLTRDRTGQLGLALGDAFALDGMTPDLPTLVTRIDKILANDRLSRLQSVEANALTLRFEDARARRGWTVDGGRLLLERDSDTLRLSGDFALLGGGATATRLQLDAASAIGSTEVAFGVSLDDMPSQDIATQGPALAWLGALRAPISGSLRARMRGDGTLGPLNAALQIGSGVVQPDPDTPPVPFDAARSYFTYDPERAQISFTELSVDSALIRAVADGRATLTDLKSGIPSQMLGQVQFSEIEAAADTLFETPLSLDRAELDFRLGLDPFELDLGRLWIDDPQVPLRMSGKLATAGDAWSYALDGQFGALTPKGLVRLWPTGLAPRTRDWVVRNIEDGAITDGQFALRSQKDEPRPVVFLNAAFDRARVRYARSLPVAEQAKGTLTLNAARFAVRVTEGRITPRQGGPIDIAGTTLVIPNTRKKPADAQITMAGEGRVEALLSYLDSDPINLMQKARRPVDLLSGRVRFGGTLNLPLRRGLRLPDMALRLDGRAINVASDRIVPNRDLTARALDVSVTNDRLRVSGQAALSGVPFDGTWTLPIPEPGTPASGSTVEGTVTLSDTAARAFGVALPVGMVSGSGPAALRVDLRRDAPPEFTLSSNLRGIGMSLPPIGWRLPRGSAGTFQVAGALDRPARIDTLALDAPGLTARGAVRLNDDGSLGAIELERVRAGGWLDAPVTLRGRGPGLPPAVRIGGGTVDLRSAPFGRGNTGGAGAERVPLTLALDALQVSDSIRLAGFRADLQSGAGLTGSFTASVNGKSPITGEVLPQAGGTAFRIRSDEAGKVFREAGLLKTVAGGDMTLALAPVSGQPGSYDGALDVTNARLRNAPGIASLLDAISIVGLLDQLEGPGILFTEVEARFRLTPDQLYLTRSSATGPSMGISLDGTYNLGTSRLDLQGVLSPIFFLNGIGSILTRKGEGLIGFNFSLTGPADQPNVGVNPLSALTPGMFREIFRRPAPVPGE